MIVRAPFQLKSDLGRQLHHRSYLCEFKAIWLGVEKIEKILKVFTIILRLLPDVVICLGFLRKNR